MAGSGAGAGGAVRVRLMGEELVLRSDGDPGEVERLAAELDGRVRRLAAEARLSAQPTKAALLVALNLLAELRRLEARHDAYARSAAQAASSMLQRLDAALG